MRVFLLTVFMSFIYSCAPVRSIHPAFEPYVARFEILTGKPVTNIHMEFKELERPYLGYCTTGAIPTVYIDPTYWDKYTELKKEALIFHELGHCKLGRPHLDKVRSDGCPVSIMHTFSLSSVCHARYYDSYIEELKNPN